MAHDKLHSVLDNILQKIDKIDNVISSMNEKLCKLEENLENINKMQKTQPPTQIAMMTSISSSEDKIKLLNQQTNINTQEDLLDVLSSKCIITDSGIFSILDQTITIYEYIADVIYTFDNESQTRYICCVPDTKNSLFFWNHSKKTWAKVTKSYLQEMFMVVQQKIIIRYNELMNKDNTLKKGSVENGDLIFVDDFEKKYTEFKKSLNSKFI